MADFTHKGVVITVTSSGTFQYRDRANKSITKPSLKAAQTAIDKEVGTILVPAMKSDGEMLKISGKDAKGGYVDEHGRQTRRTYARIMAWDEEASKKLEAIRQQERDEYQRHREAMDAYSKQRRAVWEEVEAFDYDAAVKAELARRAAVHTSEGEG